MRFSYGYTLCSSGIGGREGVLLNKLWQECNFLNVLLVMLILLTGEHQVLILKANDELVYVISFIF